MAEGSKPHADMEEHKVPKKGTHSECTRHCRDDGSCCSPVGKVRKAGHLSGELGSGKISGYIANHGKDLEWVWYSGKSLGIEHRRATGSKLTVKGTRVEARECGKKSMWWSREETGVVWTRVVVVAIVRVIRLKT